MASGRLRKMGPLSEIPEDEWDRVMAVNVKGIWQCTKAVLPSMMQQKYGKIINISSTTVQMGVPGLLHYVASKGAVFSWQGSDTSALPHHPKLVPDFPPSRSSAVAE